MAAGALRSALSAKLRDGELTVVREFAVPEAKTKSVKSALVPFEAKKMLLVEAAENRNLELGARNLEGVVVLSSREVTVYHLLDAQRVLVSEQAAQKLSQGLDPRTAKDAAQQKTPEQRQ